MYRLLFILAEIETLYFYTTADRLHKLLREARERAVLQISNPCRECHALRQELLIARQDHDNKIKTLRQDHDSQLQRMRQKMDSIALEQDKEAKKQTVAINIELDCLDRDPKIALRPYLDPDDSWNKHNLPSVMDLLVDSQ